MKINQLLFLWFKENFIIALSLFFVFCHRRHCHYKINVGLHQPVCMNVQAIIQNVSFPVDHVKLEMVELENKYLNSMKGQTFHNPLSFL